MKIVNTIISVALSVLLTLSLCITLALSMIYFTVSDIDSTPQSISDMIDEDKLSIELSGILSTTVNTYGFDGAEIAKAIDVEEAKRACGEYIEKYFNVFITGGTETPTVQYSDNGSMYNVIDANKLLCSRPELFENEENVRLLADECVSKINLAINALSIDKVLEMVSPFSGKYIQAASLGRYFVPSVVTTVVLLILTALVIVLQKRRKTAYGVSLAMFGVSVVFTIPFAYFSSLDLASRLNINAGIIKVYADALFSHIFGRMTHIYTGISIAMFIALIASIIWLVRKKKAANK